MSEDRLQILKMIETGQISTEEALKLLDALGESALPEEVEFETGSEAAPVNPQNRAKGWWIFPTAAGAVVMAIGAPLLALGLTGRAALFWAICCGWIPFLIGLAILTLGVWSRNARWLYLSIKNARSGRRNIALGLPLPLTLAAWVLRLVRPYVPQLRDTAIDEAILALRDGAHAEDGQP